MKKLISAKKQAVFFFGWTALLCLWGVSDGDCVDSGISRIPESPNPRLNSGWLTNNGSYLRKIYCMQKPDGTPDWGFIIPIIVLSLSVVLAYLIVYQFWIRNYFAVEKQDRLKGLMSLANIFLLCAISGYLLSVTMFYWPAYRLYIFFLSALSVVAWNFVIRHKNDIGLALQAVRFQRELSESAKILSEGSDQINASSQSLASGTNKLASALQEIGSSLTQIASQSGTNLENVSKAGTLVSATRNAAQTGTEQMQQMQKAMDDISSAISKIAGIMKIIDEIAFKTNLLALNAAIEAARAGEHGKGFAVVAEEVRMLAGRSAGAAKETSVLIDESLKKVESGIVLSDCTAQALKEILESITEAKSFTETVAHCSREQAQGVAQVSIGLSQIETVAQNAAAGAEQHSAISGQLLAQAVQVEHILSALKGDGYVKSRDSRQLTEKKKRHDTVISEPVSPPDDFGKY